MLSLVLLNHGPVTNDVTGRARVRELLPTLPADLGTLDVRRMYSR